VTSQSPRAPQDIGAQRGRLIWIKSRVEAGRKLNARARMPPSSIRARGVAGITFNAGEKSMRIARFSMPEGWEDWTTLVIGLWLFASPWTLQVDDPDALENFLVVGALVITFELITFYTLRVWEEWINIVLGAWLIVWSFAMSGFAAVANAVVCGALLLAVSLYEMWDDRRQRASR
jgi:hypothetical protein